MRERNRNSISPSLDFKAELGLVDLHRGELNSRRQGGKMADACASDYTHWSHWQRPETGADLIERVRWSP